MNIYLKSTNILPKPLDKTIINRYNEFLQAISLIDRVTTTVCL